MYIHRYHEHWKACKEGIAQHYALKKKWLACASSHQQKYVHLVIALFLSDKCVCHLVLIYLLWTNCSKFCAVLTTVVRNLWPCASQFFEFASKIILRQWNILSLSYKGVIISLSFCGNCAVICRENEKERKGCQYLFPPTVYYMMIPRQLTHEVVCICWNILAWTMDTI